MGKTIEKKSPFHTPSSTAARGEKGNGGKKEIIEIIIIILIGVAYITLAERKILGGMQRRKGPNLVGIYGLLQPISDGVKLVIKEIIIP